LIHLFHDDPLEGCDQQREGTIAAIAHKEAANATAAATKLHVAIWRARAKTPESSSSSGMGSPFVPSDFHLRPKADKPWTLICQPPF